MRALGYIGRYFEYRGIRTLKCPIVAGGAFIECVSCFKLCRVHISDDLTWAANCDAKSKKANRRLYALRVLKKCGLSMQNLTAVYCSLIRSVLEYTCVVFANLPQYLSNALESIQKRALGIIGPNACYEQALSISGLTSLRDRIDPTCKRFVSKTNSILIDLLSQLMCGK